MLWVKPSVKIWRYCFLESSWFGRLFNIKVNLSQASYKDSVSPCLKFWISIFLSQYFDIGKYFYRNFSSSSSHVWMIPLGMVSNQSLALPVKVKGNNCSFFWLSVTVAGGTQNSHVSTKRLRCSCGFIASVPSNYLSLKPFRTVLFVTPTLNYFNYLAI